MYQKEFIKAIPKTDLHVHLDGSLRLSSMIEMAKERKIELPSFTEEGLKELVFKDSYASLDEYLEGFSWTCQIMQDRESLERTSYELAMDNFNEGVRYLEVRFAPQLHMSNQRSFELVMESVDRGLRKARKEINQDIQKDEPPFEYGIIVCAMRFCNEHFSEYYADLFRVHTYSSPREVIRFASMELAQAAVKLKNETDIQIVAFDLAGSEYGYPASVHQESYDFVHKNFLKKTVHAGEAYGPESIFQAITKLHSDRIGHGLHLFDKDMIYSEFIENKDAYIRDLSNYIADNRTTIEVCLTSNLQTSPEIGSIKNHSVNKMLEKRLSVTFCTDNRLVSNTTVTNELNLAVENLDISSKQLKDIIIYGFKRSFFYCPYEEKRKYVRKVIDYYEKLEQQFQIK